MQWISKDRRLCRGSLLKLQGTNAFNGMVRHRSLEVVECSGKEASHETTRARR